MKQGVAKVITGFAASQTLTHGAFALNGTRFSLFGLHYTPELNTAAALFWAIAMLLLIYYAWRRPAETGQR